MLKILNTQFKTITGAAAILAGATLLNKIVGILRDRIIAHYFGAGPITDAYYAAFKLPDLVYNLLVVGALTAGFIPVFNKLYNKNEKEAWRLASNVFNLIGIALLIICSLGIVFAPRFIFILAPGFSQDGITMLGSFSRIMFLSPFLLGLSMVAGGILQSLRKFLIYSLAPIFYNLGIIFGASILTKFIGPTGLAWGVVLGAFLHFLIQIVGARHAGYRWSPNFDIKDAGTRLIGKLMIPRTAGLAVSNLNILFVTILASLLPAGSVAALNFADNLQWVPVGIIGVSYALAAFPLLSSAAANNEMDVFFKNITATIKQIIFLVVPVSVLYLLLRAQIVRVILGSGAFDWDATINTANALAFFAFGLLPQSLIPLLARGFYALSDTKTPFAIGVISALINIIASLLLLKPLGVAGLALSLSVGSTVNAALLYALLKEKSGKKQREEILPTIYKIAVAGIFMGITTQLLKYPLAKIFNQNYFWGIFGQGLLAGLAGLFIYGFLCYILR